MKKNRTDLLQGERRRNFKVKNSFKIGGFAILCIGLMILGTIISCKKDEPAQGTDKDLYEMSKVSDGFVWYKNNGDLLKKSNGSGHSQPFLRTRYNAIAATMLDGDGKIKKGANFPEGSLIVKELYKSSSSLGRYAILFKKSGSVDADSKGWVWGYINEDGTVSDPASNKGTTCINCHSQSDNIDYMLMNKYFP